MASSLEPEFSKEFCDIHITETLRSTWLKMSSESRCRLTKINPSPPGNYGGDRIVCGLKGVRSALTKSLTPTRVSTKGRAPRVQHANVCTRARASTNQITYLQHR